MNFIFQIHGEKAYKINSLLIITIKRIITKISFRTSLELCCFRYKFPFLLHILFLVSGQRERQ